MSNKSQGFSRNLQQEQKEFERKAKQAPAKENKEKQKFNPGNKETNSNFEQSNHYQKEKHEKRTEAKVFNNHKNMPVYHEAELTKSSTYQPHFNQNMMKEQGGYQEKQKQQVIKDIGIDLKAKQDYVPLYHNVQSGRISGQTNASTYHSCFNQNVIKEEEEFQKRQKKQQFQRDTASDLKSCSDKHFEIHKIKSDEEKNDFPDKKSHDQSTSSRQERTSNAVSGSEAVRASSTGKAGGNASTRMVSIENSNSIPFGRMRPVGAEQPQKGELNLKNIHTSSMLPYRITGIEKNLLAAGVKYLIGTAYKGTDTQKGVEYDIDIYATSGQFVTDQIRIAMTKSMIRESNSVLRTYHDVLKKVCGENGVTSFGIIGNVSNYKDVVRMQKGVNSILMVKYGKGIKGTGWVGYVNAMQFLRKNKGQLDPEIQKLIRETFKRTSAIQMFKGNVTRLRAIKCLGMRKIRRYLQQTDTGYGLYFALDIVSRTKSILRGAVFAIRSIMKATEKATLIAVKTAAWAAAKGIKYGSKLVPKAVKETKAAKKIVNGAKKVGNGYKKAKGAASKSRGKVTKVRQNIQKFQRNPFGIRTGMNKLGKKATDALTRRLNKTILAKPARALGKGYRYINKIISVIGRGFSFVGTAISTVIHVVLMGVLLLILCGFLVSIISSVFTMIFSIFDFNTHKKEIREACSEQIEESYKEQIEEITKLRRKYRNMTIDYKDLKDEDVYEEKEIAIRETTNSAEILSMATVYFDFDLEKAGKRKAKKYVRELYNGSHLISIVEKPYIYEDSNGEEVTVIDADVTLTTYYFNHLFNCELKSGSTGVIAGSEITEQVWNYLRSAGIPAVRVAGIMGNIQAESGFNSNLIEYGNGIGFGLCQWSYGRRTALENYAASKGKPPGDLEVQLEFLLTELGPGNFNSYHTGENNYNGFMNASDPETAAYYFMWGWERPAVWAGNSSIQMRQTAARTFYDNYIDREIITEESEENEEPEE